ncbi:unnamed protein product [Alternaria alternata]
MTGVHTKECEQRAQTDDYNIRANSAKNSEFQKNIIPSIHSPDSATATPPGIIRYRGFLPSPEIIESHQSSSTTIVTQRDM